MFKQLEGYKTYILSALAILVILLEGLGKLPTHTAETLVTMLGFGGVMALRHGMKKTK
jgi:hypothetical protein